MANLKFDKQITALVVIDPSRTDDKQSPRLLSRLDADSGADAPATTRRNPSSSSGYAIS
jgi:hypothetical protein